MSRGYPSDVRPVGAEAIVSMEAHKEEHMRKKVLVTGSSRGIRESSSFVEGRFN
jgi:hypothetical protein